MLPGLQNLPTPPTLGAGLAIASPVSYPQDAAESPAAPSHPSYVADLIAFPPLLQAGAERKAALARSAVTVCCWLTIVELLRVLFKRLTGGVVLESARWYHVFRYSA